MHVVLTVCPKNWVRFRNSCYKFSSKSASSNAAKASCEAQGSHLVVINSRAENQALGSRVIHSSHHMHIGLHRDPNTSLAGSGLMVRGQPLPIGVVESLIMFWERRRVSILQGATKVNVQTQS